MELVEIRRLDDCLDGAHQFSYRFDRPVTENLVRALAAGGRLDYFADFLRPFFKIYFVSGEQAKGVAGDDDLLVFFPSGAGADRRAGFEADLRRMLAGWPENG
jgi:hypothetical protein